MNWHVFILFEIFAFGSSKPQGQGLLLLEVYGMLNKSECFPKNTTQGLCLGLDMSNI